MSSTKKRDTVREIHLNKSTGPTTKTGKSVSSKNATRHGLFSKRLILEDEEPTDFESLQIELQRSLAPVGMIELALVEKVAITIWRQRRLVSAESATLALQRHARALARDASSYSGAGLVGRDVREEELQPFDQDRVDWCTEVVAEVEALDEITVETLKSDAPHVWQQLQDDAEDDYAGPEDLLAARNDGATGYVTELYAWCKSELRKAAERPELLTLAEQLSQKRLILPFDQLQLVARYQTTLDNQLYKALKSLRDAQEWRLKTLDAAAKLKPAMHDEAA